MVERAKLRWHRYLPLSVPALTILLLVLLCVPYPHTWRLYITYVVARLGSPLIGLFLALAVLALLFSAFLKYRRKSGLIAACLAISIALHLIAISVFSLWVIKLTIHELAKEAGKYDLSLGLPSLVESMVSQAVREKLLEPALADMRQFETRKTSKIEPAEMAAGKAQPHVPETPIPAPTREQIKLEQIAKPEQKVKEKLEVLPEKPPEVDSVEIAKPKPVKVERKDEKLDEPLTKPLEVEPVPTDKQLPEPGQLPRQAELKEAVRPPTRQEIDELLAEQVIAHKVEEMIQAVEMTKTLDRLNLPAKEVPVKAKPLKTEGETVPKPTATFRLSQPAAQTPETPSPRVKLPEIADVSAKMSTASLADTGPARVERRPMVDAGVMTGVGKSGRSLDEPLRVKDRLATVARTKPSTQSAVSMPPAYEDLNAGRSDQSFAVLEGAVEKPQAKIEIPERPVAAETFVGPRTDQFAPTQSEAPEVREQLAASRGAESPTQPMVDVGRSTALVQIGGRKTENRTAQADMRGELAASKVDTLIKETEAESLARLAPGAPAVSAGYEPAMATLIGPGKDESAQPESETPKVQEQLAIPIGDESLGRPIVNVSMSTALMQTGAKKIAAPSAEPYGRVELATVKPETRIEEAAVAFTPRPEKGAKLEVTASHLSLMDESALVEPSPMRTAIEKDSEIQPATGKALEPADVGIVAGSLHMTREQRPRVETKGGGEAEHELHGMEVTRARPLTEPDVSKPAYAQPIVQGKVPVQTGKLAETDVRLLAETKKPSSVEEARLVTVPAVTKIPEAMSLTIAAQAAKRGQGLDSIPPVTVPPLVTAVQVAKATVAEEPTEVEFAQGRRISRGPFGEGGATGADTGDRPPERIQPEVSGIKEATVEVPAKLSAAISTGGVYQSLISVETTSSPEIPPQKAIYKLRTSENRKRFIEELGGTLETEEAVEKALAWLAKAQSDDGRWDVDGFKLLNECGGPGNQKDGDVAVTGLSLLAYLGAGYTHTLGDYREPIRKALEWLIAGQNADGDLRRGGQMYGQAMATAALCEAYSMTHDAWLLPAAQRAVKFILDAQTPGAGWRYEPRDDSDTSVVGWQVLALKSAAIAGIKIPNQHFIWAGAWIDSVRKGKDGGLYSYKPGHAVTPTMTAEGWFCQLFISEEAKTRGITESIDYIMKDLPQWAPDSDVVPHLYYWYYATLSLYLSGAKEFDVWNAALSEALLKGHVKDGAAAGTWDPVCQLGPRGGRIYSTAMATLCLEVYYRYLPFYKQK